MAKIIIAILIIGAIAVGGYSMQKHKDTVPASQEQATSSPQTTSGKKIPFASFIKGNGSYQCTVHQYMSDVDSSGTMYTSDGNIRGEFTTIAEGRTIHSSIIIHDGFIYTWSDAAPTMGFKMAYTASPTAAAASGTYMWNAEQIGDYNCEPWAVDASKFTPPTSINFKAVGNQ